MNLIGFKTNGRTVIQTHDEYKIRNKQDNKH